jgi:hypothetical protein
MRGRGITSCGAWLASLDLRASLRCAIKQACGLKVVTSGRKAPYTLAAGLLMR